MMDSQKYDADKLRKIIETTLSNYANMIKRLERKKNIAEIMLIYYSVFLIIGTLTGKYFPQHYNVVWNEYFNIILSIIVLIFSLYFFPPVSFEAGEPTFPACVKNDLTRP